MILKDVLEVMVTAIVCILNVRFLYDAFEPWATQKAWDFFGPAAMVLLLLLAAVSLSVLKSLDKEGFPRIYHGALAWPLLGTPLSLLVLVKMLTPAVLVLPALVGLSLSGLGIAQDWRDWLHWRKSALLFNVAWAVWGYWIFSVLRL
ncbi:MAG: hypothetical protein JXA21_30175 [Anaerolineae bacterium]|nr:hypothetical protein [Anaerolineae bacterium]